MGSYLVFPNSRDVRRLGPSPYSDYGETGLFAPEDEDAYASVFWTAHGTKPDGSPLDVHYIVGNDQEIQPNFAQVQGQQFGGADFTQIAVACDSDDRPAAGTTFPVHGKWFVDPGAPNAPVTIWGHFRAAYVQPTGTTPVVWTTDSPDRPAPGAEIYAFGSLYVYAPAGGDDATHLTVVNAIDGAGVPIAAARVTVTAP